MNGVCFERRVGEKRIRRKEQETGKKGKALRNCNRRALHLAAVERGGGGDYVHLK